MVSDGYDDGRLDGHSIFQVVVIVRDRTQNIYIKLNSMYVNKCNRNE